ncbi:MAG: ABC transporter substrate-binding protein [Desulfobacterales bacterium]|nr:ABC transporter substrate-binding protein [Desulfobacterales bacterium]
MLRKKTLTGLFLTLGLIVSVLSPPMHWSGERALPSTASVSRAQAHHHGPKARRIVSMAPNITETIFALGCGDCVVAATDFCTYPAEARALPKVGGYFNPNLERLTALCPDLLILQGKHEKVDAFCRAKGIPVLHVAMDSISSIYRGIVDLGSALHRPERAEHLCTTIRHQLEAVQKEVAGYPRQKVFICLGRAPSGMTNLYTAGGPSFISEILQIAGGDNIFADVTQPYPEASKESLLKRAPEIIIEMRPGEDISDLRRRQIIAEWDILRGVPAVSNRRVYVLTEDLLLVPGPRVGVAARFLAKPLHPEIQDGS